MRVYKSKGRSIVCVSGIRACFRTPSWQPAGGHGFGTCVQQYLAYMTPSLASLALHCGLVPDSAAVQVGQLQALLSATLKDEHQPLLIRKTGTAAAYA